MNFVCFNGKIVDAASPLFNAQNRSFRYGDGIFETIKVFQNNIKLAEYHFDRLFTSLRLLQIETDENFTAEELSKNIIQLCSKNQCSDLARLRLAVYRCNDNKAELIIEAFPLSMEATKLNEVGLTIGLYPYARKPCDAFANLKTANYLPYVMADFYAHERGWDQSIVLNTHNKICDASKANVFLIIKNQVYTPALHQGCISGVMRRYIVEKLKQLGYLINQTEVDEDMMLNADEVFLTNAIIGIKWVKQFRNKEFICSGTTDIYKQVLTEITG
jgi:branched-chain amino acid aminotransferase